jgi:hypothetical protein
MKFMKRGDLIRHKRTNEYAVILSVNSNMLGESADIYVMGKGVITRSMKHYIIVARA